MASTRCGCSSDADALGENTISLREETERCSAVSRGLVSLEGCPSWHLVRLAFLYINSFILIERQSSCLYFKSKKKDREMLNFRDKAASQVLSTTFGTRCAVYRELGHELDDK